MRDSVNGNSSTLTLTITSKPVQQSEPFKPNYDCTMPPNGSNLKIQNNTKNGLQNLSQIIGQLAGAMQYMDPKAAAFRTGLKMMSSFANQLNQQNNNSSGYPNTGNSFDNFGAEDLLSSLLGYDDECDCEDEDQNDIDVSNLLSSLNSLFGNNYQNNEYGNDYGLPAQNKKQQQLRSINSLIGGLSDGLSSGVIPSDMSGNVNQLIGQLSNQANCLCPAQDPVSGFSSGLSLAMLLLRK